MQIEIRLKDELLFEDELPCVPRKDEQIYIKDSNITYIVIGVAHFTEIPHVVVQVLTLEEAYPEPNY